MKLVINNNNEIINNSYGRLQDLICSSKSPWARKRMFSEFIDDLGTRPQKGSPALLQTDQLDTSRAERKKNRTLYCSSGRGFDSRWCHWNFSV